MINQHWCCSLSQAAGTCCKYANALYGVSCVAGAGYIPALMTCDSPFRLRGDLSAMGYVGTMSFLHTTLSRSFMSRSRSVPRSVAPSHGSGPVSGIVSTVVQGIAFGAGSAVAHRGVNAVANVVSGNSADACTAAVSGATSGKPVTCDREIQQLLQCATKSDGQSDACAELYESVRECKRRA